MRYLLSTNSPSSLCHLTRESTNSKCVQHARQALAIDEVRYDFRPEIWRGNRDGQTLEQRWFAGVPSNVGGGYVDDGRKRRMAPSAIGTLDRLTGRGTFCFFLRASPTLTHISRH
ncbi:MAG TPA: DUF2235 domain-containing protein [Thermoanaerobaculia bacterium]